MRVLSALGSGGMGDVYRAHDTNLNRDVAVDPPDLFANDLSDWPASSVKPGARLLDHPHIAAALARLAGSRGPPSSSNWWTARRWPT
jgi:serine/threonine protein kinase